MTKLFQNMINPPPQGARYIIDPVAFFLALIGGPVLVTAVTCWLIVPIFALALGGPAYLIIGTPVLLIYLARNPAQPSALADLALRTVFLVGLILGLIAIALGGVEVVGLLLGIAFFAAIFAPLWAAAFGWLYARLRRDFYAHPHFN